MGKIVRLFFSLAYFSTDDALRYLTRFGFDGIGQFIMGDRALERYVASASDPSALARRAPGDYVRRAREQMVHGQGSSAAGEQPKFLVASGWSSLLEHPLLCRDFRTVAQAHLTLIDQSRALGARLPKPIFSP